MFEESTQKNTKTKPIQILTNLLLFLAGLGLLYLAFRNQKIDEIIKAIQSANLWVLVPVILANLIGSLVRALRWQLLIRPLGHSPYLINVFNSLMFGYFVNYAVPRLGEVTRCITLKKKENISFSSLFGTVMSERLVDLFMLFITVCITLLFQFSSIYSFFADNIFGPVIWLVRDKLFKNEIMTAITLGAAALIIYLLFSFGKKAAKNTSPDKIDSMVDEIWSGLLSIIKMKNYGTFIIYTIIIWIMYFSTSYFWLLAFDGTKNFDLGKGMAIFVISTLARSVPIQGGAMGAYHYLVTKGLALFGISQVIGNAYAIVNHGSNMIYQLIVGSICGILILITKDKIKPSVEETGEPAVKNL